MQIPDARLRIPRRRIADFVGERADAGGRRYADDGRVTSWTWQFDRGPDARASPTGTLVARIRGTAPAPYTVRVSLADASPAGGRGPSEWWPTSSNCLCPMRRDCKHVAALLHAARTDGDDDEFPDETGHDFADTASEDRLSDAAWAVPVPDSVSPATTARHASAEPPTWRNVLREAMIGDALRGSAALAIGVDLVVDHGGFGFSRFETRTATADDVEAGRPFAIALRPLREGVKAPWIRGGLTWRTFRSGGSDTRFAAEHRAALGRLVGMVLTENPNRYDAGELIRLDDLGSAEAWRLLRGALDVGIPLVGTGVVERVSWGEPAAARLDVARTPGGDLVLSIAVERDGKRLDGAIPSGSGGWALVRPVIDGDESRPGRWHVELVPAVGTIPRAASVLLDRAEPLRVPAADADEFLVELAPQLGRVVPIVSTDASVEIPAPEPPRFVLEIAHEANDRGDPVVRLRRSWAYSAPSRTLAMRPRVVGDRRHAPHPDRDLAVEDDTLAIVREAWPPAADPDVTVITGVEAAEFVHRVLPRLAVLEGVEVRERGDRPPFTELDGEPRLRITQIEPARASDRDWLDLGFEITIGEHLVPFTVIFTALSLGKKAVLLPDKTYAKLDHPVFDRLRELLAEAEAMDEWEPERPRIGRYQVTLWEDFEDLADASFEAVSWRDSIGALRRFDELPARSTPAGLAATLRPYQLDGFAWLAFLYEHGLGGILADDMGLGKTLQTLALIVHARELDPDAPPFLVIAPSSVLSVWRREAERFAPGVAVRVLDTTSRTRGTPLDQVVAGADLVVTSYAIARLDDAFEHREWSGLVLDEAQFVKNRASKTHRAVGRIRAPFRLAITGTPLENSLTDLWALLSLTAPGLFASPRRFREEYVRVIEEAGSDDDSRAVASARLARLRRRVRPFVLRRSKELVAPDLPPKQEQRLDVTLAPAHRRLYERVLQRERRKLLNLVDDLDRNRFIVFRSLTLLRMLALDPAIVDDEYRDVASSKLDALMEHLPEAIADGHRAIVFSQFTSFLSRVAERLDDQGITYAYLDGSTRDREAAVSAFRDGAAPVFLISLKAGGFGLTLTEADYVFVMDPWWNPAAEAQAVDRAHRIGQTRTVMVYRLVAEATIEQKVLALQERKAALFDAVTDGGAAFSEAITADDIRELFADG